MASGEGAAAGSGDAAAGESGCAGAEGVVVETVALEARSGERGCSGCCRCCCCSGEVVVAWMGFRVKVRVSGTRKERRAWARSG